jgi:hypothetical protein
VDDASVLISHANPIKCKNTINEVCVMLDDLFEINLMSLDTVKANYINFTVKNKVVRDMGDIGTIITNTNYTKFLCLTHQYAITWDRHVEEILKKLSTACYMIRNIQPVVSMKTLKRFIIHMFNLL